MTCREAMAGARYQDISVPKYKYYVCQADSAASSLSSSSSAPPPSPSSLTSTLSPPTLLDSGRAPMITPPATPPWQLLSSRPPLLPSSHTKHALATPPAIKKHSTGIRGGQGGDASLSKSKSHESELSGGREEGEGGGAGLGGYVQDTVPKDKVKT